MMRKIVVMIVFFSTFLLANSSCGLDTINIVKKLEKQYAKELKGLVKKSNYNKTPLVCKNILNSNGSKSILVLSYHSKIERSHLNHSLIIAMVDRKKGNIEKSYFHKNVITKSNLLPLSVTIETKKYAHLGRGLSFGIYLKRKTPYREIGELILYEEGSRTVKVLSEKILLYRLEGYKDERSIVSLKYNASPKKKEKSVLRFERFYHYQVRKDTQPMLDEWDVKLDDVLYRDSGSGYVGSERTPVFDMEQIEAQAKEGLHFKMIVLNALVYEKLYRYDEDIAPLNNIAYYFYQHKFYNEAIYLLEKIVTYKTKRAVAHLNLADAYWAVGLKMKAKAHYATYKRLQEESHKKVLKRANKRGSLVTKIYDLNLSRGFVQVHSNVEPVHPLILENRGETKPKAIVPWLQKKLFATSEGKLVKVLVYEKNGILNFLYFCLVDKSLKLYLFDQNGKEKLIEALRVVNEEANAFMYLSAISNHEYQNYSMDEEGVNFFFEYYDRKAKDMRVRHYRYSFKEEAIVRDYTDSEALTILKFENHEGSAFVAHDYDGEYNKIAYNGKEIFTIKTFEDGFVIGDIDWSPDDEVLYFDNHGEMLACIWRYDFYTKELTKIVPEHEAEHPFTFTYKGREYVVYIEGQNIKVATEFKKGKP